jgi:hypothetical protein
MTKRATFLLIFYRNVVLAMTSAALLAALPAVREGAAQSGSVVWRSSGPNASIKKVVVDPHNPNIIYAGSSTGIFKSVNHGASWSMVSPLGVLDLSLDRVNAGTIYAAALGGVLKTPPLSAEC